MDEQSTNRVVTSRLIGFSKDFNMDPQDWSLAVSENVTYIDPRILEIWKRFYDLNYLQEFGHQCLLISAVLRRILRLHGFPARTEEIITKYSHDKRQWNQIVGVPERITHAGTIDTHRVVVCGNLILDWSQRDAIYNMFGAMSPRGFVGSYDKLYTPQELGFFGQVAWEPRPRCPATANIDYYIKSDVMHLTQRYFEHYLLERVK